MEKKPRILTIKEAAKLIDGLSEYRIRQMCINGQVPCFMAGSKYLISEKALLEAVLGKDYVYATA
jgi:excisionase family DNA binding protein